MKTSFKAVAVTSLCALFACGGGGADLSTTVPNLRTENPNVGIESISKIDYRDFAPMRESRTGEGSFGKWISEVKDPNTIDVHWPPSIEEFRIRDYAGEPWVILDAYNGPFRNVIRTTRVEIKYGDGPWISLPTGPGNPYTPVNITQRFTLRQWGWVSGACGQSGVPDEQCGDNSVRYFWQHTITPRGLVTNICWHDALTNTRETLMQQEAWWSTGVGWHSRSTPGEMKDGLPTGENIVYLWHQTIAKGAGFVWTSTFGCLVR